MMLDADCWEHVARSAEPGALASMIGACKDAAVGGARTLRMDRDPYDRRLRLEDAQLRAVVETLRGRSLLVTGASGTGKSVVARRLARLGFTVTSATSLGAHTVGGSWLRRFFQVRWRYAETPMVQDATLDMLEAEGHEGFAWPRAQCTRREVVVLTPQLRSTLRTLHTLVIDGINMLSADLLEGVDQALRVAHSEPTRPFGGVQIVLIGDFGQLPPLDVSDNPVWPDAPQHLYAFQASVWPKTTVELTRVWRQSRFERDFVDTLSNAREGRLSAHEVQTLSSPRGRETSWLLCSQPTLCAHFNRFALTELEGVVHQAAAIDTLVHVGFVFQCFDRVVNLQSGQTPFAWGQQHLGEMRETLLEHDVTPEQWLFGLVDAPMQTRTIEFLHMHPDALAHTEAEPMFEFAVGARVRCTIDMFEGDRLVAARNQLGTIRSRVVLSEAGNVDLAADDAEVPTVSNVALGVAWDGVADHLPQFQLVELYPFVRRQAARLAQRLTSDSYAPVLHIRYAFPLKLAYARCVTTAHDAPQFEHMDVDADYMCAPGALYTALARFEAPGMGCFHNLKASHCSRSEAVAAFHRSLTPDTSRPFYLE